MSRTPPGVRELKPWIPLAAIAGGSCRTPPGVRELKHHWNGLPHFRYPVAPLPGCVN